MMTCERCFQSTDAGEHGVGLCPLEPRPWGVSVVQDTIEGGVLIAHGLCHEDGTPQRFDSKSAMKLEAARRGLVSWSEGWSENAQILKEGREYTAWTYGKEFQQHKREKAEARRMKGREY